MALGHGLLGELKGFFQILQLQKNERLFFLGPLRFLPSSPLPPCKDPREAFIYLLRSARLETAEGFLSLPPARFFRGQPAAQLVDLQRETHTSPAGEPSLKEEGRSIPRATWDFCVLRRVNRDNASK